jgi:hypothetical protein
MHRRLRDFSTVRQPGSTGRLRRVSLLVLVSALCLPFLPRLAADGGTLRIANYPVGAYRVSVFTNPTPIPPDTIDVSVLVTIGRGQEPAPGLDIEVVARRIDGVGPVLRHAATRAQATDPRYYAANFALGSVGEWEIRVRLKGPEGEGDVGF